MAATSAGIGYRFLNVENNNELFGMYSITEILEQINLLFLQLKLYSIARWFNTLLTDLLSVPKIHNESLSISIR